VLLDHFAISKPLQSLHKFNERQQLTHLIELLLAGKNIALISDAGTPCIQDPGALLVKECHLAGIEVSALPGPCAFVTALALSGETEGPSQFIGFIPKKEEAAKEILLSACAYEGHSLAYVSPHQLIKLLDILTKLEPERPLFLVREISKHYEEHYQGPAKELLCHFQEHPPKGEFVLMIKKVLSLPPEASLPIAEHVAWLETTYSLSKNDAIKLAAKQRGVSKRDIYNVFHQDKN